MHCIFFDLFFFQACQSPWNPNQYKLKLTETIDYENYLLSRLHTKYFQKAR